MAKALVFALHGFLGSPTDWQTVIRKAPEFKFICGDLFSAAESPSMLINAGGEQKIFLGYSLGGRIGLDFLQRHPEQFDHYVFLSTNPGYADNQTAEREQRLVHDQKWADRISAENWNDFVREWNTQKIFDNSISEPVRQVESFDLNKLRNTLIDWSLAKQPDRSDLIRRHATKITWVVGDQDLKYRELAEKLGINFHLVASGHRIWLDNPDAVVQILKDIK